LVRDMASQAPVTILSEPCAQLQTSPMRLCALASWALIWGRWKSWDAPGDSNEPAEHGEHDQGMQRGLVVPREESEDLGSEMCGNEGHDPKAQATSYRQRSQEFSPRIL